jgi:hypothetical protein
MDVSGRAKIRCLAAADGSLSACAVLEELPSGYGFGAATLKASSFFRLQPTDNNGLSVAGKLVAIPMRWQLSQPAPGAGATFLTPTKHILTWATVPSKAQVNAAYPANAKGLGIVSYHCITTTSGTLTSCAVASETPAGRSFGTAGLQLLPLFQAGPRWDGAPLDGSPIEISLRFYPPTEASWVDVDGIAAAH